MKVYILIGLFSLLCSCSKQRTKESNNIEVCDTNFASNQTTSQKEVITINIDSIKRKILVSKEKLKLSPSDTVKYKFSLEDVGTEGNEGIAYYLNDSVQKIKIDIYTSMWKYDLLYLFDKENIKVTERTFNIANVHSGRGIELIKTLSYRMDKNGVHFEKIDSNRIDIFQKFKKVVPFVLKW